MLFFKNMFHYMAKIVHVFLFIYLFILLQVKHTEKKQKLHTIKKVIKRKK